MQNFRVSVLVLGLSAALAGCGGSDSSTTATTTTPPATTTPTAPTTKSIVAVVGDMPYGTGPTDTSQVAAMPTFINAINADTGVSLLLHAGDLHSGKEPCTLAYDTTIATQWKAFKIPVVYTPGDNEWADCHKTKQYGGSYVAATGQIKYVTEADYPALFPQTGNLVSYFGGEPLANLQLVRDLFFTKPGYAWGGTYAVHSQGLEYDKSYPKDAEYKENVWFIQSNVLFVTINVPGGSNNDNDIWFGTPTMADAQKNEITNRTAANLRWLDTAFAAAKANGVVGVVITEQGDMWDFDGTFPTNAADLSTSHIYQYKAFIDKIATNTLSFGKPVLLFNGDFHVYRTDNPLLKGAPCWIEPTSNAPAVPCTTTTVPATYGNGATDPWANQPWSYNVPNFRRIGVHGSTTKLEYVRLTIDPTASNANAIDSFGPFSWARVAP